MIVWERSVCSCSQAVFYSTYMFTPAPTPAEKEFFLAYIIVQEEIGNSPSLVCVPLGVKNVI